jgi:lambda repressor-like predicted transcriptional regulator
MANNTETKPALADKDGWLPAARRVGTFLVWSLLFGIAYTQPRLYYSNQNQYFLHGLAQSGHGFLNKDWLANTADPTPLFTALVAVTSRYLHESSFYIYTILLIGIYFHALVSIFEHLSGGRATPLSRLGFLAFLVLLHSALLRFTSAQLFGVDYPWYFQAGVANQYILGAGLQPSMFGVLLVLSVSTFLRGRPLLAATWSSLAAVMHSTYLLAAAFLTLAYLYLLLRDKRIRTAFLVGSWALLLVVPVVIYNLRTFGPSSPETFAEAQSILAQIRIPHHAEVSRWLDGIAWAQIGWVIVAMFLARGSRLFVILLVPFVLGLTLTLVQLATGNDTLALLFPWRVSAILVPIATAIVLTRLVQREFASDSEATPWQKRIVQAVCLVILTIAVAGGAIIIYYGLGYRTNTEEVTLLEYIRARKKAGEVYLIPVEVPKLNSGKKGTASLSFTPPPRRSTQQQNISVDLQQFRLFTGVPIYIDFKSIPYKDVEVLEWHRRVLWNDRLYQQRDWNKDDIKAELRQRGITHVVIPADRDVRCDALQLVYADKYYRLYRVRLRRS